MQADVGQQLAQPRQLAVLGAEIVTPVADAVRFVDRHEAHAAGTQERDEPVGTLGDQPFRRDVEQPVPLFAQPGEHRALLVGAQRAVEERRRDAVADKGVDLVLHQRDQG
ncbi:hypothetical protein D3C83_19090 [compost metagenome]